ncbi:MAG: DUF2306 domain-containing protein [Steroidobacteraceae bacterium]
MSSTLSRTGFGTMAFLSLGVAGYAAVVYGLLSLGSLVHPDMKLTYNSHSLGIYTHVFGALFALLLGPWQFSTRLRVARPNLHRWMGRVYLGIGVLIGGLAGLYMAFHAFGGGVAQSGFGMLALLWLFTGLRAYLAIRAGDVISHRRWMVRNFALSFAAVTLRLWLPGSVASGIAFEVAYPVIAWACWVPNLVIAEIAFNRGRARTTQGASAST